MCGARFRSGIPTEGFYSNKGGRIGTALAWKDTFTGSAAQIANGIEAMAGGASLTETWRNRLTGAATVTESAVLDLWAPLGTGRSAAGVAAYQTQREQADVRLVLNFVSSDAATALLAAADASVAAYAGMAANTNLSDTALRQQLVAARITRGNRAHAVRVLLVGHYSDDARNARLSWAVPVSAIRCPSKEEQWH